MEAAAKAFKKAQEEMNTARTYCVDPSVEITNQAPSVPTAERTFAAAAAMYAACTRDFADHIAHAPYAAEVKNFPGVGGGY